MSKAIHADTAHSFGDGGAALAAVRSKWGWFVALGVALLILGALAFSNLFVATLASVIYIGVVMMLGAVAHIVAAFQLRRWGAFFLWLLSGLLYGAAASLVFYNPVLAAGALTLVAALAMVFAGGLRIGAGVRARPGNGWGWIIASGVMTFLVGIVIALGWPANTLWLLGLFLAIDLTFQGVAALFFGFALKSVR